MDEAHASSLKCLSENEIESPWILSLNFQGQSSEYDVIWAMVLLVGSVMDEAHASRYLVNPGADKTYYNLGELIRLQDVKFARIYIDEIVARNEILVMINSADGQSGCMVQTLGDIMRACVIDFGGSYHSSIRCTPFEALYGRKCKSPVLWAEIGESSLIGLEFLKESVLQLIGSEYTMSSASSVHDTFHVSNLKKCLADANLHVPLSEIKVNETLRVVEEPVGIMDREVKRLKCSRMVIFKVVGCFFSFGAVMLLCVPLCGQSKLLAVRYLVKVSVYVCVYVDYVGVGTQSIERDRLIGIGVVLDNSFRSLLSDGEMIIEI
ncbi:hypothetical protein Tco_0533575 [Tanacetum coccineum]